MTIPDPIDAAALAMHAADCGCRDYVGHDAEDEYYLMLARAAAPILIAAGREQVAEETCACPCNGTCWDGEN